MDQVSHYGEELSESRDVMIIGVQFPEMPEDPIPTWGVARTLRNLIYHRGGVWTSKRALDELTALGWKSEAGYAQNVVGNLLARLWKCGALVRMDRGLYNVRRDVLAQILSMGLREFEKGQRETPTVERRPGYQGRGFRKNDQSPRPVNQVVLIAPPN